MVSETHVDDVEEMEGERVRSRWGCEHGYTRESKIVWEKSHLFKLNNQQPTCGILSSPRLFEMHTDRQFLMVNNCKQPVLYFHPLVRMMSVLFLSPRSLRDVKSSVEKSHFAARIQPNMWKDIQKNPSLAHLSPPCMLLFSFLFFFFTFIPFFS